MIEKVKKALISIDDFFLSLITVISPKLNSSIRYRRAFHKRLNLNNPQSFNEKLIWLKLYDYPNNSLVIKCSDKLLVREYVEACGLKDILNDLLFVFDSPKEIYWDNLPEQFVLKWNFGAGFNLVCKDKSKLIEEKALKQLTKWGKKKYWLPNSELHYKKITKRIVCEKFLSDRKHDVIPDYKVYCFNGNPMAILVMFDRGHGLKTEFFDVNWNKLGDNPKYDKPNQTTEKPECLDKMIEASCKLSKPFKFVRCDFYVVNNKLVFGELTFTPAGGLYVSQCLIDGKTMSELLLLDFNDE